MELTPVLPTRSESSIPVAPILSPRASSKAPKPKLPSVSTLTLMSKASSVSAKTKSSKKQKDKDSKPHQPREPPVGHISLPSPVLEDLLRDIADQGSVSEAGESSLPAQAQASVSIQACRQVTAVQRRISYPAWPRPSPALFRPGRRLLCICPTRRHQSQSPPRKRTAERHHVSPPPQYREVRFVQCPS